MSKQNVTDAVFTYLTEGATTGAIPYLGTVYKALPKIANEADLFTNSYPGLGLGATIYMFMTNQVEHRIALGGEHNGRKWRDYDLGLLIIFKSDLRDTIDGQTAFDQFIDGLTSWIQADRTAGCAVDSTGPYAGTGYVFQWGEGNVNGGPDIRLEYTFPRTLDGGVTLFQAVAKINTVEIQDV